jgi:hypothetical protein
MLALYVPIYCIRLQTAIPRDGDACVRSPSLHKSTRGHTPSCVSSGAGVVTTMRPIAVVAIIAVAFITVSTAAVMEPQRGDREHAAAPVRTGADSQLSALMSLYNATGGPHWANNAGWSSVPLTDPCITGTSTWFGVACNGTNVTYLAAGQGVSAQPSANGAGLGVQFSTPMLDLSSAS